MHPPKGHRVKGAAEAYALKGKRGTHLADGTVVVSRVHLAPTAKAWPEHRRDVHSGVTGRVRKRGWEDFWAVGKVEQDLTSSTSAPLGRSCNSSLNIATPAPQ